MKKMLPLLALLLWAGMALAQEAEKINQEVRTETDEFILVGKLDRTAFLQENYAYWYVPEYEEYEVSGDLSALKQALADKEILLFLGTWCTDSQREVPRLFKILDAIAFDFNKLTLIGLDNHPDNYKQSPQHEEVGWEIEYVPTIILLSEGKEVLRIEERPAQSLEADLLGQ